MKTFILYPTDVLFFRDGRPFETSGGHGARWPQPSVLFDAIHAALWRTFQDRQPWEHWHDYGRSSHRPRKGDTHRFGSLVTAGPFPVRTGGEQVEWFFPAPADVVKTGEFEETIRTLVVRSSGRSKGGGRNNLPPPLKWAVASPVPPLKYREPAPWWTRAAWDRYLEAEEKWGDDEKFWTTQTAVAGDLFESESVTGIGISPDTAAQDKKHIYAAEYLRLKTNVAMGALASMPMKQNGDSRNVRECITEVFDSNPVLIMGGQQRVVRVETVGGGLPLPRGRTDGFETLNGKHLVKWVLLSPAIWPGVRENPSRGVSAHPGGWLPNWVDHEDGRVRLVYRAGQRRREWDESRRRFVRRAEREEPIAARLVAAVVPRAIPVSGWTERLHLKDVEEQWTRDTTSGHPHGARPLMPAVPAGAVYYFEADSEGDARRLASVLNWHGEGDGERIVNRRSTLLGEKGFGLGVCGTWRPEMTS